MCLQERPLHAPDGLRSWSISTSLITDRKASNILGPAFAPPALLFRFERKPVGMNKFKEKHPRYYAVGVD